MKTNVLPYWGLAVAACFFAGCSTKSSAPQTRPTQALSAQERSALSQLSSDAPVSLAISSSDRILTTTVSASEVLSFQDQVLKSDRDAVIAINYNGDPDPLGEKDQVTPDEAMLFSGKQEFGIGDWEKQYPEGDGRGVRIGIVDDGIALGRPGLISTSTGLPKITRSIDLNPYWQVPLANAQPFATSLKFSDSTQTQLDKATLRTSFEFSSCGVSGASPQSARNCMNWDEMVGKKARLSAVYFENSAGRRQIAVDLNSDGKIDDASELFEPISDNPNSYARFNNGTTLGFDVHEAAKIGGSGSGSILNVIVPQQGDGENVSGSHGEGVAGIAGGFKIAGRAFNGVAPGAQLIDVDFVEPLAGGSRYSIASVAQALKAAGSYSDVVNTSYSLFFSSVPAQIAMKRFLEETLKDNQAIYLFSAGNNGPGIGSMNRALIYPSFSIPVGAYLNGLMSQSTFGSSVPMQTIAPYSSVGPGFDGATGPLVISPLAGIAPATADLGFQAFSGTSSATPALAGFVARILSVTKKEGLPLDRLAMRAALIASADPFSNLLFIEQGYGLPKLMKAIQEYRANVAKDSKRWSLKIEGAVNSYGIERKGIYVRDARDRADQYSFSMKPEFQTGFDPKDQANFAERVNLVSKDTWVLFPKALLLSRSGTSIQIALDWDQLASLGTGLSATQIEVRSADTGAIKGIIPVTIIQPQLTEDHGMLFTDVRPGEPARSFLKKPVWATHLIVSRESSTPQQSLCGRTALFNPSSVRDYAGISSFKTGGYEETVYETPYSGLYEWDIEGRLNHQICPRKQTQSLRYQWIQISASLVQASVSPDQWTDLKLQFSTHASYLVGKAQLSHPVMEQTLTASRSGSAWNWTTRDSLDLSKTAAFRVKLDDAVTANLASLSQFPSWNLAMDTSKSDLSPIEIKSGSFGTPRGWSIDSKTGKADDRLEYSNVHFRLSTFDEGLSELLFPRDIAVVVQSDVEKLSDLKLEVPPVEVREGTPSVLTVDGKALGKPSEMPLGVKLSCQFVPIGFTLAVPCGEIALP